MVGIPAWPTYDSPSRAFPESSLPEDTPAWVHGLPAVNASLNGLATLLLVAGYALVKRGRVIAHRNAMLSCFGVSVLFLACYLVYHFARHHYEGAASKSFEGPFALKVVYFPILITHIVLAAAVPVLAVMTIVRGLRGDVERHRRLARWTYPIWLYVSVTGVVIYVMLYHLGTPPA